MIKRIEAYESADGQLFHSEVEAWRNAHGRMQEAHQARLEEIADLFYSELTKVEQSPVVRRITFAEMMGRFGDEIHNMAQERKMTFEQWYEHTKKKAR